MTSPGIHASQRETSHPVSIPPERSSGHMERPPPYRVSAVERGSSSVWRRQDSNLGRLSRQIYSGLPSFPVTSASVHPRLSRGTDGGIPTLASRRLPHGRLPPVPAGAWCRGDPEPKEAARSCGLGTPGRELDGLRRTRPSEPPHPARQNWRSCSKGSSKNRCLRQLKPRFAVASW